MHTKKRLVSHSAYKYLTFWVEYTKLICTLWYQAMCIKIMCLFQIELYHHTFSISQVFPTSLTLFWVPEFIRKASSSSSQPKVGGNCVNIDLIIRDSFALEKEHIFFFHPSLSQSKLVTDISLKLHHKLFQVWGLESIWRGSEWTCLHLSPCAVTLTEGCVVVWSCLWLSVSP